MGLYKEGKMHGRDLFYSLICPISTPMLHFPIRKVSTRPKVFGLSGRPVGSTRPNDVVREQSSSAVYSGESLLKRNPLGTT
jgi:hypothetical protein